MRLFGDFGTIRVGAVAKVLPWSDWFWDRQWTLNFFWAQATFTRTIELNGEDLFVFCAKGICKSGRLTLKMSQGNMEKDIDLSNNADEKVDMTGFRAGLIKLVLVADSAKRMKVKISWRRT
jgi:hypothetical protein